MTESAAPSDTCALLCLIWRAAMSAKPSETRALLCSTQHAAMIHCPVRLRVNPWRAWCAVSRIAAQILAISARPGGGHVLVTKIVKCNWVGEDQCVTACQVEQSSAPSLLMRSRCVVRLGTPRRVVSSSWRQGCLRNVRSHIPKAAKICKHMRKMGSQNSDQKWFPKW